MSLSGAITGWNSQWIKRIECPRGKIYCREKLPLAFDPNFAAAFSFVCQVESSYTGLMQGAEPGTGAVREPQLSGNLLYAGELDEAGRALVFQQHYVEFRRRWQVGDCRRSVKSALFD